MAQTSNRGPGEPSSPDDQASYRIGRLQQWAVVAAVGEIDLYTSPGLRKALLAASATSRDVIVDLSAVTFLDSTALGVLATALQRARESDGSLCLVGPSGSVSRVLELTRLDEAFTIYPNLDAVPRSNDSPDSRDLA